MLNHFANNEFEKLLGKIRIEIGLICQLAQAGDLLAGVAGQGRTKQWMRETTLAGLPATQALFTNAEEVLVAWVLPTGGRPPRAVTVTPVRRTAASASPVVPSIPSS